MTEYLAFGDLETTGLDPDSDAPLEFGLITVEEATLRVVDRRLYLFQYPIEQLTAMRQSCEFGAHETTGLWDELFAASAAPASVADNVIVMPPVEFDELLCAAAPGLFKGSHPELAGFGPHFDQRFLRRYAPDFLGMLHYRLRDVRTLAREVARKYPTDWGPKAYGNHRALSDCEAAIEYLKWYRQHVMIPYGCRPIESKTHRSGGAG